METIRNATPEDAAAIAEIYNDAVLNTTAIWNDHVSDAAGRAAWMAERQGAGYPVLVAIEGDTLMGYATYGPFRPHDGYRHSAELSIYVRSGLRGKGTGSRLLAALTGIAEDSGIRVLVGGIEAGNAASIALHRRHGFAETGRLPQVGTKFGRWLDLVFMTRVLGGPEAQPSVPAAD
ncbi:GNAT family N-acetyltransferase [Mangrovicoccus sp. HB161399]|uniref:GNAT family N-acetyltransferase n=1 Tax=Mangrovicoccus sp. HB161399 TaxID=2720392 RepID=UPI002738FD29|nr:GNAT family N-acetyltransferase [Mangrovicoccus sp. HB161399]